MEFAQLQERALAVRTRYEAIERQRYGRAWTTLELGLGLVGDVGDLAKLLQAEAGIRTIDDWPPKLAHELADVLWSVIVIARRTGVDLERSFLDTMQQLEDTLVAQGHE